MKIAFTLCSINYLAQAKTLGDSLLRHNPDYRFVIGLVDENRTGVDLSFLGRLEVLEVAKIGIEGFADMCASYDIVELVTSVKPFYIDYLFRQNPQAVSVTYFDPDMKVFTSLADMDEKLRAHDVLLTPHFTGPPAADGFLPTEKHVLNTGVFNLGYVGMRRGPVADGVNRWWMSKLRHECLLDLSRGYFVDQLWMNLAPAYFDGVLIVKHPGWNIAHWNFGERTVARAGDGGWLVNGQPLVFFHFSHYTPKHPERLATFHTRFSFESRPDLVPLYDEYRRELTDNRYFDLIGVPCAYVNSQRSKQVKKAVTGWLRRNVPQSVKMKIGRLLGRN